MNCSIGLAQNLNPRKQSPKSKYSSVRILLTLLQKSCWTGQSARSRYKSRPCNTYQVCALLFQLSSSLSTYICLVDRKEEWLEGGLPLLNFKYQTLGELRFIGALDKSGFGKQDIQNIVRILRAITRSKHKASPAEDSLQNQSSWGKGQTLRQVSFTFVTLNCSLILKAVFSNPQGQLQQPRKASRQRTGFSANKGISTANSCRPDTTGDLNCCPLAVRRATFGGMQSRPHYRRLTQPCTSVSTLLGTTKTKTKQSC